MLLVAARAAHRWGSKESTLDAIARKHLNRLRAAAERPDVCKDSQR
jgi:hypothetical protein